MERMRWLSLALGLGASGCLGTPAAALAEHDEESRSEEVEACREVELVLEAPPELPVPARPGLRIAAGRRIVAKWYDARIYLKPEAGSLVVGYARRGQLVGVKGTASGEGCQADLWYALDGGGYACAARDFRSMETFVSEPVPIADAPLPYGYAKVTREGALRFRSLAAVGDPSQGKPMTGAYFITVVETIEHDGRTYYRTDGSDYVAAEDAALLSPPAFAGEVLREGQELPLAFVQAAETSVFCDCEGEFSPCGRAHRMARSVPVEDRTIEGVPYVRLSEDAWIARDAVRIARRIERPASIAANDRWIHVDLAEQVVVAYEGDVPVFATLAATGKEGHETPTGTWRIERRYVSTTMSGPDDEKGTYTVAEVPWTMFYHGAFALHGAYWHSEFGNVRSHGCTNLPPADARWLFIWGGGVPPGWHAQANDVGPWVHVTSEPHVPLEPS